jgi:hypothetical protein
MTFNPQELDWNSLMTQIRNQPQGELKQTLVREAVSRIWDGWNGDESRVPLSVFEP